MLPTWSAGVRMGLAKMPSKVRPVCPAARAARGSPGPARPARVCSGARQVLGWFPTVQDDAGALHVVSWLMQNFKMEVWCYGWKCGFILCVCTGCFSLQSHSNAGGEEMWRLLLGAGVCVFTGVTCPCVQQHRDIKA